MTPTQIKECSLKKEIGRQSHLKQINQKQLDDMNILFTQNLGMLSRFVPKETIDKQVWEYVSINWLWWEGDSSKVGVFTTIADYQNKAGEVFKAHYSDNWRYIRRARNGEGPVAYTGHFPIRSKTFNYTLSTNKDGKYELTFAPKPLEEIRLVPNPFDEMEAPLPIAVPINPFDEMEAPLPTAVGLNPFDVFEKEEDSEDETLAEIQARLRR